MIIKYCNIVNDVDFFNFLGLMYYINMLTR